LEGAYFCKLGVKKSELIINGAERHKENGSHISIHEVEVRQSIDLAATKLWLLIYAQALTTTLRRSCDGIKKNWFTKAGRTISMITKVHWTIIIETTKAVSAGWAAPDEALCGDSESTDETREWHLI
jgi:hypothetical protein